MDISIDAVINKQLEVIQKLQAEVIKEPLNAYTPHKVDALKEAATTLVNLSLVKRNLETIPNDE